MKKDTDCKIKVKFNPEKNKAEIHVVGKCDKIDANNLQELREKE